MMISRLILTAACCALWPSLAVTLITSTAVGETFTDEELYARFMLFAECKPMQLVVADISKDAAKIDLTKESIQAAAESRLRSARLYSTEADQYLFINTNVYGSGLVGERCHRPARREFGVEGAPPIPSERPEPDVRAGFVVELVAVVASAPLTGPDPYPA